MSEYLLVNKNECNKLEPFHIDTLAEQVERVERYDNPDKPFEKILICACDDQDMADRLWEQVKSIYLPEKPNRTIADDKYKILLTDDGKEIKVSTKYEPVRFAIIFAESEIEGLQACKRKKGRLIRQARRKAALEESGIATDLYAVVELKGEK